VVLTSVTEARIPWRLACSYPTKKDLKGQIKADGDVLQRLHVD
jgi:hypothetical protein